MTELERLIDAAKRCDLGDVKRVLESHAEPFTLLAEQSGNQEIAKEFGS